MNVGKIHKGAEHAAQLLWVYRLFLVLFASSALLTISQPVNAQTVNQYTISEPGGSNDITAARTCGIAGSPLVRNFTVGTSFTVSDVDLGFLASHAFRTDINVILQSPAGTRVTAIVGSTAGGNTNLNVRLSDEFSPAVNSASHGSDNLTPTPTPYQRQLAPNNALSAFDGENSLGTWRMEICDMFPSLDDGNFLRADLWLTELPTNYADLSLSKSVSNSSPAFGSTITYTLQVTNAVSSPQTATGVVVNDILPTGTSFVSASGFGSYNSATGNWSISSIAPGQTRSLSIVATVNATAGAAVVNSAEITASSQIDLDSVVNNGATGEDDYDTASFTVSGTRVAGTPPNLGTICSPANQITFDWDSNPWAAGSLSNSYSIPGIGTMDIDISLTGGTWVNDASFGGLSPALANANNGGFAGTQLSLHQYIDFFNRSGTSTMTVDLPTAVPGLQFTIFDIDFAANDFADMVTVTGSFNGTTVIPTLTNGIANYVAGNTAIGDTGSGGTQGNGNVVVTFSSPVDTITIVYGNASTAPADPDGQAAAWFDMTFCAPTTTLSVTKISQVLSDPVNDTTDPKAIPGAIMQYCILISNAGSASAEAITATDTIPANVTYNASSMQSGSNCGSATTPEDDDATGADENDPFGASISGTNLTATAASLGPAEAFALTFQVTVD